MRAPTTVKRACRRHRLAVTSLAWSPDGAHLASASLDGDAVIWDAAAGTVLALLQGDGAFLKGVAWDPVGSYVATIGDDRAARLWAARDWECVAVVERSLEHMSLNAVFCRRELA